MNGSTVILTNGDWDFRECNEKFQRYATKKHAIEFAKERGWRRKDVHRGFNSFFRFYFVGQMISPNQWRILRQDGTIAEIEFCSNFL